MNDALWTSLAAGRASHPVGAASVREIYASDLKTLRGFGVLVKTEEGAQGGEGWYFYETFSVTPGDPYAISDQGAPGCVRCHTQGADFIQSQLPLR